MPFGDDEIHYVRYFLHQDLALSAAKVSHDYYDCRTLLWYDRG